MRIAFDLDGVLADFTSAMIPLLNKHVQQKVLPNSIPTKWSWADLGATKLDVSNVWKDICASDDFFLHLHPLIGAQELYISLVRGELAAKDLIFLTSRPETKGLSIHDQCVKWLTYKLGLHEPFVWVVPNAVAKINAIEDAKIDFLIDDFPPTVYMAKYVCKAYMLRQPWNKYDEEAYSIPAVDSVKEFLTLCR